MSNPPLLTVRSALVALIAVVVGLAGGVLAYLASAGLPGAALIGASAAGGALGLFHSLIGPAER